MTSTPASTCGYCSREGTVSLDQRSHTGNNGTSIQAVPLGRCLRFHCSCGNEWLTPADQAEQQGRFLDTARLR